MIRSMLAVPMLCTVVLGLACGDPDVRQQSAATNTPDATYTPTGQRTRIRVEAVESMIRCDGEPHDVRIWLDDLAREPEAIDPTRPTFDLDGGVLSFAFKVSYDPGVVWVAGAEDVRLGDALDRAAPDPGYDRNFTLPNVPIDNQAGKALVSPLPVGIFLTPPPSGTPRSWQENNPPGFDPLAAGKPILLATVGLTGMGEGESRIDLGDVRLYAGDNLSFAPATVIAATVRVEGECKPFATATPLPVQTEETLVPPTPGSQATPELVTPTPAEGIRDDCPAEWAVATEEKFSFCYPPVGGAVRSISATGDPTWELGGEGYYLAVGFQATRTYAEDRCAEIGLIPGADGGTDTTITADGRLHPACMSSAGKNSANAKPTELALIANLPWRDGYLTVFATMTGDDVDVLRSQVQAILETVELK